jgi:hypothetical protein
MTACKRLTAALLGAVLLNCAGPLADKPLEPVAPEILLMQLDDHISRIRTFQGHARITMVTSDGPMQGTLDVAVKMPDSLWLKVEGPLGVDMLIGHMAGEYMVLYNPWEDRVYRGSVRRMQQYQLLPLFTGGSSLISAVIGLPKPEAFVPDLIESLVPVSGKYIMDLGTGEQIWIEAGGLVSRWEQKDEQGNVDWRWEGRSFQISRGFRYPKLIPLTTYQPSQRISIFYQRVRFNRSLKTDWYELNIPEGVMSIEL